MMSTSARSNTKPYSSLFFPFFICIFAALFYFYDYFIQAAPSVMTQQLMQAFSVGAAGLGLLGSSFFYAYTLMQIPSGLLLDRFGARKILTLAVFISASGVTLFGVTEHFAVAAFARFLIGLGSACAFVSVIFLVARWLPHQYFAFSVGVIQLMGAVGSVFGEAPLAIVINHFGWRHVMITIGLITFGLSALYWLFIRDRQKASPSDLVETSILDNELQRLQYVFQKKEIRWVALCGLVSWVPVGIVGTLWGIPYLMKVYGWHNVFAGNICALFWLGVGIGSPLMGWYASHISNYKKPFIVCFSLGIMASLLIINAIHFPAWITGSALFLLGVSAAVQALTFGVIKAIVSPNAFGTTSGFINMAAILGGGFAQLLVGVLLHLQWNGVISQRIPVYTVHNYQFAFVILLLAAVIGLVVSWFKMP